MHGYRNMIGEFECKGLRLTTNRNPTFVNFDLKEHTNGHKDDNQDS